MSNNPSSTTKVLPVRVENELFADLDALAADLPDTTRTALARLALRRGLDMIAAELGQRAAAKPAARAKRKSAPKPAAVKAALDVSPYLLTFAGQVLESARRSKTGRFGDNRVFINHVWRQYKRDHKPKGMDLDTFKQRLVEANRERCLSLVAADMAPLLDQKDVKESEIRYLTATFHFLCI